MWYKPIHFEKKDKYLYLPNFPPYANLEFWGEMFWKKAKKLGEEKGYILKTLGDNFKIGFWSHLNIEINKWVKQRHYSDISLRGVHIET